MMLVKIQILKAVQAMIKITGKKFPDQIKHTDLKAGKSLFLRKIGRVIDHMAVVFGKNGTKNVIGKKVNLEMGHMIQMVTGCEIEG